MKPPIVVAHRGDACSAAENSLGAFAAAAAAGVDEIEFDVHLTRDGALAVVHDAHLEQTACAHGPAGGYSGAELAKVRLRGSAEFVPLLHEALDRMLALPVRYRLEIKRDAAGQPYPDMPARIMDVIGRSPKGRWIVTSFEPDAILPFAKAGYDTALWYWRAARPEGPSFQEAVDWLDAHASRDIAVYHKELTSSRIDELRERGFTVGVWPVNGPSRLDYWLRSPVDYVVTDQPGSAVRIRNQVREEDDGARRI